MSLSSGSGGGRPWARIRVSGLVVAGFTLLEVVIALLVLEVAVLGSVGILVVASQTLSRAERLERIAALAEGVLDSLAAAPSATAGSLVDAAAVVEWTVGAAGEVLVTASTPTADTLLELRGILPPSVAVP